MQIDPVIQAAITSGVISLVGLLVSFVINWRLHRSQIASEEANAGKTISDSALGLIKPLQQRTLELETQVVQLNEQSTFQATRITELETERIKIQAELVGLRAGVVVLTSQLIRLGLAPEYVPKEV